MIMPYLTKRFTNDGATNSSYFSLIFSISLTQFMAQNAIVASTVRLWYSLLPVPHPNGVAIFVVYYGDIAMVCEKCNKQRSFGHNVSHAKNRTNRAWKPNIQNVSIMVGANMKRVKLCTRCIRTMHKDR